MLELLHEVVPTVRRETEDLRGLLGKVLDQWEDMPPDLRAAIERALASRL